MTLRPILGTIILPLKMIITKMQLNLLSKAFTYPFIQSINFQGHNAKSYSGAEDVKIKNYSP